MRYALVTTVGLGWIAFLLAPANGAQARRPSPMDVNAVGIRMVQSTVDRRCWFATNEISVSQFRRFVLETGYVTEAEQGRGGLGIDCDTGAVHSGPNYNWNEIGAPQHEDDPVLNLTVADANAFCRWLSATDGRNYRLANAADWERYLSDVVDSEDPAVVNLALHERTWYMAIAQTHPAVRAFQTAWLASAGRAAPEIGQRTAAPAIVREALAAWNFREHPASRFGFRIVRIDSFVGEG